MAKLTAADLQGSAETLLITLYLRAKETQRADAMIRDDKALGLVQQIDVNWERFKQFDYEQTNAMLRAREIDRRTREFLARHPDARVIEIGCGLDTRFYRVDNGLVEWYDLDVPKVIALRRKLFGETPRHHWLSYSALDFKWMNEVDVQASPAILCLSEGVLMYLREAEIKCLVLALKEKFPGAEFIFDALAPLMIPTHNLEFAFNRLRARLRWGLARGKDLENWGTDIFLLGEWFYFDQPEPRLGWMQWLRWIPIMKHSAMVVQYRLGKKAS